MTPPIAPPAIAPLLTEEELDCAVVGVVTGVVVGIAVPVLGVGPGDAVVSVVPLLVVLVGLIASIGTYILEELVKLLRDFTYSYQCHVPILVVTGSSATN